MLWSGVQVREQFKNDHLLALTLPSPSIDDAPNTTQAQQRQPLQEESDLSDSLFSMYLNRASDEDKEMVESWKEDANGMLTFVRLQTASHTSACDV